MVAVVTGCLDLAIRSIVPRPGLGGIGIAKRPECPRSVSHALVDSSLDRQL